MITEEMLYWIFRLDAIRATCVAILSFGGLFGAIMTTFLIATHDMAQYDVNFYKKSWKFLHKVYIALAISIITLVFLPSTKEMVAIKIIPVICNNKFIQENFTKECKDLYILTKLALKEKLEK